MTCASVCRMKRTSIFLEEPVERDLEILARRQGRPKAALVRDALHRYLDSEKHAGAGRLAFVAVGRSGRSDVAERHEELLAEEWSGSRGEEER